ncbi:MAG: hypothetical protein Q7S40_15315 [Opitutaceae bacterium]|nr:hypothetical protein [Opitutaceae bacterium]
MKIRSKLAALGTALLLGVPAFAANINAARTITANTTWTKDNTYLLQGYTFVINNATLTIEPGTVIKGKVSTGADAAALIVTRGAKIMAEGTASAPIIFTSELDNLNGNLGASDTGLWGGVLVLGHATINSRANNQPAGSPAQDQIEGLSVTGGEIGYATFGGTNDDDNSGVLRYISIRHGGAVIGGDNEINGLTLGGVGRGTTLEYIEVFANKDDGIEFFGGTVNLRNVVLAFGNDDGLDFDQGYRGNVQFVFNIQTDIATDRGDKGIEWDGATAPLDATPKGNVTIANVTMIGIGTSGGSNTAVNIRDNVEAKLYNSVFVNFAKGLDIEDDVGTPRPDIANNIWFSHVAANNSAAGLNARPAGAVNASAFWETTANNNAIVSPQLRAISYTANRVLDPRPAAGSPALSGAVQTLSGSGLTQVGYKGAFSDTNWAAGWTKLWTDGYFSLDSAGNPGETPIIAGSANKFINISTRGFAGSGDQVLTAGFVILPGQAQTVLIRGVGPTLAAFGVGGVLGDPVLEVFRAGATTPFATNDNWSGTQPATLATKVGAFALQAGSLDAALVLNLEAGGYTVQVKGKGTATGVAIVEVYEVD